MEAEDADPERKCVLVRKSALNHSHWRPNEEMRVRFAENVILREFKTEDPEVSQAEQQRQEMVIKNMFATEKEEDDKASSAWRKLYGVVNATIKLAAFAKNKVANSFAENDGSQDGPIAEDNEGKDAENQPMAVENEIISPTKHEFRRDGFTQKLRVFQKTPTIKLPDDSIYDGSLANEEYVVPIKYDGVEYGLFSRCETEEDLTHSHGRILSKTLNYSNTLHLLPNFLHLILSCCQVG